MSSIKLWKPAVLYSRIFRRKPGIRLSMAPEATIQIKKIYPQVISTCWNRI